MNIDSVWYKVLRYYFISYFEKI